jgi:truncated hemoglobin YjbI
VTFTAKHLDHVVVAECFEAHLDAARRDRLERLGNFFGAQEKYRPRWWFLE